MAVGIARERQYGAGGNGAEQHGADYRAGRLRDGGHVEKKRSRTVVSNDLHQRIAVRTAIAQRHLFGGRQAAAARADDLGAINAAHAVADLSRGFEQFG